MRAGCFTLVMFLPSSGYFCSLSHPRGGMGYSVVCVCVIFLGHSLTLFILYKTSMKRPFTLKSDIKYHLYLLILQFKMTLPTSANEMQEWSSKSR